MKLTLTDGRVVRYCVMIPSKDRVDVLALRLRKMPHMNHPDVFVGVENGEWSAYRNLFVLYPSIVPATYDNPSGSVSWARQQIKQVVPRNTYDYYVTADDNTHVELDDLNNLVRCCAEWPKPAIMAGLHRVSLHFDRNRIAKGTTTVHGLRSYASVSMMLVCAPAALWEPYTYPHEAFGLDDRHWFLWLISKGYTEFRVCLDASFRKPRYQKGGQGSLDERAYKCGLAIAQLAKDFPAMVGSNGTLRIPWDYIMKRQLGETSHRLAMGSTMRTDQMTRPAKKFVLKRSRK